MPHFKKKAKFIVKKHVNEQDAEKKKEISIEDKYYWSKALTGLIVAILGVAVFHLVGWWLFLLMMIFLLAFPFFLSFVVFRIPYNKEKWSWKQIIKNGIGAYFFIFVLVGTIIHTVQVMPQYQAVFDNPADTKDIIVENKIAYIADGQYGLKILNVSSSRELLSSYKTAGIAYGLFLNNSHLYIAEGTSGLEILDISNPASPTLVGSYAISAGDAREIFVLNSLAFLSCMDAGVTILNMSNPQNPVEICTIFIPDGLIYSAFAMDSILYVGGKNCPFQYFNITNPYFPVLLNGITTNCIINSIYITRFGTNTYALLAMGFVVHAGGLWVINVTDPETPAFVSNFTIEATNAFDVQVLGNNAFVAYGDAGVAFVDLYNIVSLSGFYVIGTWGPAINLDLDGDYIYVAKKIRGLAIISMTAPVPEAGPKTNSISFGWAWIAYSLIALAILIPVMSRKIRRAQKVE